MATKVINLLPKELTVSKGVQDITAKLTKYSYTAIFLFVLVLASGGAAFFYFRNKLANLEANRSTLETNIQSLQETEQQIILTKDRVAKLKVILDRRTNEETFNKHRSISDNLPESITIENSEIGSSKSEIAFAAKDSRQLVSFMSSLLARADKLNIVMGSLSFDPFQGYNIVLEIF